MASRRPSIGKAELEVLRYVSDHHPVSVRDVADHMAEARGLVRTTVLNVMSRLCTKGYLARKKADGIYQYAPSVPKRDLLRGLVQDFVDKALGGSLSPFVAYLAEDAEVSEEEFQQLKQIVKELDQQPSRRSAPTQPSTSPPPAGTRRSGASRRSDTN